MVKKSLKKHWALIIIALCCVVIILPPIIHGYIYPTAGDDSAEHIKVMERINPSDPLAQDYLYAGQLIVGYPLVLLRNMAGIKLTDSFMWFNYLALIGVVLTYYFVFSRLFNKLAGVLAVLLGVFVTQSNLVLFLAGGIFNIINMEIILLWMLYFAIKGITNRSWKSTFVAVPLLVLFANFHTTGVYLPVTGKAFAIISDMNSQIVNPTNANAVSSFGQPDALKALIVGMLLILSLVGGLIWLRKFIKIESKAMIIILLVLSLGLWAIAYAPFKITPDPIRQVTDATVLMSLVIAGEFGLFLGLSKDKKMAVVALSSVAMYISFFCLPLWFSYTSAIKPVDKEAIAYINNLDSDTFYSNAFIAPWVYEQYLNKAYKVGGDIYIARSKPMTPRTTPSYPAFWSPRVEDTQKPTNVIDIKTFQEDGVTIYVAQDNNNP